MTLRDLSRQPLIVGTTRFTDPTGQSGYSNESLQVSALIRIADALESGRQSTAEAPQGVVRFKISRRGSAAVFRQAVENFGKDASTVLRQYAKVLSEDEEGRFEVEVSSADDIFYLALDFADLQREGSQGHD